MLRLLVDSHPHFFKIVCFLLPMLVLLLGPRDAALRRLWNLQPLRMDPFMGAGSTGAACVQLGVGFQGADIAEGWVEKSRRRLAGRAGAPVGPLRLQIG